MHAISRFPAGIICGPLRGSFAVRDHSRSSLRIISGLGIICGTVQYYFTLSFFFLGDLIQLNYHYFGGKFMVYVFIGCFIGIWAVFAFPSQTVFQHVPLMQMTAKRGKLRSLCGELGSLLHLFMTKSCENSRVCVEPSQYGIDRLKFHRRFLRN